MLNSLAKIKALKTWVLLTTVLLLLPIMLTACTGKDNEIVILSSSENKDLEPILQYFSQKEGISIEMKYKGSVDIMLELEKKPKGYDAVWAANSLWINLGDQAHQVKHGKSIMTSPVVFGIKESLARKLDFVGKAVEVNDILQAVRKGDLTFTMTSASQSNSGASAYIGFLYALLGHPDTITKADLQNESLKQQVSTLLKGVERSSGSSEWLKELFMTGNYDAMVNYEAVIIQANMELVAQGKEPLYVVYPVDGLTIADYTLGYLNNNEDKLKDTKEEAFMKLQDYLLTSEVQDQIGQLGRRTGFGGTLINADPSVFNPEWGIEPEKVLSPIKFPDTEVIMEALNLYQTRFKKPSYTVFCLDFSGSMAGEGEEQLKQSMELLLNPLEAKRYLLQSASEDIIEVIPFSNEVWPVWTAQGEDSLLKLSDQIHSLSPQGGTDIYSATLAAFSRLQNVDTSKYNVSIVLMTDGESNTGKSYNDVQQGWNALDKDIPVFSITYGAASANQLEEISELTRARVFDGSKDLIDSFKKVRGYN